MINKALSNEDIANVSIGLNRSSSQLHEDTMEHPGASNQGSTVGGSHKPGAISPHRVRTMKEYDQEIADLTKDNFNLKLQLYFLEEKMEKIVGTNNVELFKMNVQLGVEVEMLRKELDQKTVELEAAKAAAPPTTNLQQLVQENQVLSGKLEEHRTKTDQLEQMLAQARQEVAELTETLQEATQETGLLRSQLEATQQDMEAQQKTVSELEQALQDKDQELRESLEAQEDQARRLEEALKKVAKRNKIIQGLSQQSLASFLTASPSELVEQLVKLCGGSQEEVGRRLTVLTDTLGPNHLSPKTNPDLEQECKNLHSALTEKDRFIKELLEERNRIRQENESSLRGYFSTLQQKQDYIQELESTINKYKSSDGDLLELLKKEGLELNGTVLLSDHVSVILKLLDQKESLSGGEKVLAALLDEYHRFEDLKVAEEKLQADRVHMMLELAEKNEQHAAAMNQLEKEHGEVVARLEQDKEELSARVRDEGPPLIDIGDPGAAELQQQLEQKAEEVDRLLMRQRELKLELVQAISQLQDTQRENAKLREEAKVLVAHLEEQDAFLQKLEPPASEDVEELRQQLALSKQCSELLQRRLEELADFLEALLDNRDTLELSTASVSRMRACLEETRNLSMSLSHHIHASETSAIFTLDQTAADMTQNRDAMGDAKLLLFSLEESRRRTSIAAVDKTSSEAKDEILPSERVSAAREQARLHDLETALREREEKEHHLSQQLEAMQHTHHQLQQKVQSLTQEHREAQDRCRQVQELNVQLQRELSQQESLHSQAQRELEEERDRAVQQLSDRLEQAESGRERLQEELRIQSQDLQEMTAHMASADELIVSLRTRAKEGEERGLRAEKQLVELEAGYRKLQEQFFSREKVLMDANSLQPRSLNDSLQDDATTSKLEQKLAQVQHQLEAAQYIRKFLETEVKVYEQLQEASISLHPAAATASQLDNPLLTEVLEEMKILRKEYSKSIELNKKLWRRVEKSAAPSVTSDGCPLADSSSSSSSGATSAGGRGSSPEVDRFPTKGTPSKKGSSPLEPAYSSPDLGIESDTAPPSTLAGGGQLWAVVQLHLYELLKRELMESRNLVAQLESRFHTKLCCGSPAELSALHEAQRTCASLSVCLRQGQQLVSKFHTTSQLPHQEALQSNSFKDFPKSPRIESELNTMKLELESLRKQLKESNEKLNLEQSKKSNREEAISKQLLKTRNVLKRAKGNLKELK